MSTIRWVKSSELVDFGQLQAARQDFTLHGTLEKINAEGTAVRVKLFDKSRQWFGVWFNITDTFDLEPLKTNEYSLIAFTAKIETFFGKNGLLTTKVTFTNWAEAESEPESTALTIEDVTLISNLSTDQKGLTVFGFQKQNEKGMETYHLRLFSKDEIQVPSLKADVTFNLNLTKHQINTEGVRMTGIQHYVQEKDGQEIEGDRIVYNLSLNIESINWK